MNDRDAKRVDNVYRSVKQLPLLCGLGIIIPIIGIFLLPITIVYSLVTLKLLRDVESGRLVIEEHDRIIQNFSTASTEQKLQFLKSGNTMMWLPYAVGTLWWLLFAFALALAVFFSQFN